MARYLGGTAPEGPPCDPAPLLPLPSDATQRAVVARAASGQSCVVEGPPGAGKSQTIVNAIVQSLLARRSVWVVAEKRAAVDVVGQRLAALGLGALTLDLHGGGRDWVRRLTEALRQRFDLAAAAPADPGPPPYAGDPWADVCDTDLLRHGETWLEAVPARASPRKGSITWRPRMGIRRRPNDWARWPTRSQPRSPRARRDGPGWRREPIPSVAWRRWRGGRGAAAWTTLVALGPVNL